MSPEFIRYLSGVLSCKILNIQPISGGDVSNAYLLETTTNKLFLKTNCSGNASLMFKSEKRGLKAIASTNTIATPKVINDGYFKKHNFLILEYIESKRSSAKDFELLGNQLAELHQTKSETFGWASDNFIGALEQYNTPYANWIDFYINQRLKPQLDLAYEKGLLTTQKIPSLDNLYTSCKMFFKDLQPALIHGDLWSGNYLIATDGTPYLIDPAVSYGHGMVDIAMSKLFGGFGSNFYQAYESFYPKTNYYKEQIDLYQLYYLLVHLNLFGKSYLANVLNITKHYF